MENKLLDYFKDGFDMEKSHEYSTEQLIKFSEDIQSYWVKTNELYSLTDLCEIERELTLREFRGGDV
tara:strand:+ start:633 stop:833 length:201 start_codon:yes stop_codon:yes gene_type:complete